MDAGIGVSSGGGFPAVSTTAGSAGATDLVEAGGPDNRTGVLGSGLGGGPRRPNETIAEAIAITALFGRPSLHTPSTIVGNADCGDITVLAVYRVTGTGAVVRLVLCGAVISSPTLYPV